MEEKTLATLTDAAMMNTEDAAALTQDLAKIRERLDHAAQSPLSEGKMETNPTAARFQNTAARTPEGKREIPLRSDTAETCPDKKITAQSKRYEEPYTAVPRIL